MNQDIAQEIIILRAKHGWTQQMLAEKLGTTQRTIAAWESGVSSPREDHARAHRPGLRTTGELLFRASGGGACSRADRKDHKQIDGVLSESEQFGTEEGKRKILKRFQEVLSEFPADGQDLKK